MFMKPLECLPFGVHNLILVLLQDVAIKQLIKPGNSHLRMFEKVIGPMMPKICPFPIKQTWPVNTAQQRFHCGDNSRSKFWPMT